MFFDKSLIDEARRLFPAVYVDGDRIRIYATDWCYEDADVLYNNEELKKYIEAFKEVINGCFM